MSEPSSSVVVLLFEIIVYFYFMLVIIHSTCMFGHFDNIDPFPEDDVVGAFPLTFSEEFLLSRLFLFQGFLPQE